MWLLSYEHFNPPGIYPNPDTASWVGVHLPSLEHSGLSVLSSRTSLSHWLPWLRILRDFLWSVPSLSCLLAYLYSQVHLLSKPQRLGRVSCVAFCPLSPLVTWIRPSSLDAHNLRVCAFISALSWAQRHVFRSPPNRPWVPDSTCVNWTICFPTGPCSHVPDVANGSVRAVLDLPPANQPQILEFTNFLFLLPAPIAGSSFNFSCTITTTSFLVPDFGFHLSRTIPPAAYIIFPKHEWAYVTSLLKISPGSPHMQDKKQPAKFPRAWLWD